MKKLFVTAFVFVLLITISVSANAQTVTGSINGSVKRGGTARGTVNINIPKGLHVNSNRPDSQYAIPTTVRLAGPGVRIASVRYPRGHFRKFAFSESAINVYEGRTPISFTFSLPENFRGSSVRLRAIVRYQACTEEVCYPPRSKEVTLTARVR